MKESGINSINDLKGKSVGVLVVGDPQNSVFYDFHPLYLTLFIFFSLTSFFSLFNPSSPLLLISLTDLS
jgi:hypothetical protein